ncbi:MAG: efflux RND transporter periplasmic adaptor subunit [Planctomycetaceae bacterium]|jgi:membrane fusion protein (multidrug efflux system)|nr:efflux RND transporter periplasmic adaptor subunit [Planctomycetaceae bacterium]
MPQPPTPRVHVEEAIVRDVPKYFYATGKTTAVQSVEIPARVTGVLEKRLYKKGDVVAENKPLFLIEQTSYLIAVQSAQAKLNASKAKLALAESTLAKTRQLREQNAMTDLDMQTDISSREQAAAAVQDAEATLAQAELNLKFTEVISPITGKTDLTEIAIGNLVGPGTNNSILTTVVTIDPMGVIFSITDEEFHRLLDEYIRRREMGEPDEIKEFEMGFFKGSTPIVGNYPFKGVIKALGNTINQSTGTLRIGGEIPNPRYEMLPGEVCRIRILEGIQKNAVLVHLEAVNIDLNQHYIFVVDDQGIAHRRNIELGEIQPDQTRIVLKGLQQGERYVVRGIQNVRDGVQVDIVNSKQQDKPETNEPKTENHSEQKKEQNTEKDIEVEEKNTEEQNAQEKNTESVNQKK